MKSSSTRRSFLQRAALLPLTAATIPAASLSAAIAPIDHVGSASLKPALNVFSFLELLNANLKDATKGIDLFGVCDFAAKLDLAAVDITGYFFPGYPKAPEASFIARIKRHTHALGLDISGTGIRNDFATADAAVRAAGVQLTKEWIEVAVRLGAPVVRVFAGPQPPHKDWQSASGNADRTTVETWMADSLRECAEHGKKHGVLIAVQNHGDFLSTGAEHLSLLQRVDHAWCGALVDTGKYLTADPYADIALMCPYAVNWQIKETMQSSMKSPRVDMLKLVTIIRQSGYRGYLPIETLAGGRKDYDSRAEVTNLLVQLREAIAATAPPQALAR
ncbi:MAG: sugar phosphate isomerase/epimerase family protein [Verrucomicrobiota bacterium]